jgi:hypothetical protein
MNFTIEEPVKKSPARNGRAFYRTNRLPQVWSAARENVHSLTILGAGHGELDCPIDRGKQRVVAPDPDIVSRMKFRTPLTNNDSSGIDRFASKHLHPKSLGLGVTTVAG